MNPEQTLRSLERQDDTMRSIRPAYLQHPIIRGCGHKFVAGHQPRHRNCMACWVALFRNDQQLTEVVKQALSEIGMEGVVQIQGEKFLKMYFKYENLLEAYNRAVGATE